MVFSYGKPGKPNANLSSWSFPATDGDFMDGLFLTFEQANLLQNE
jgi:hypothetical protein